MGDVAGDRTQAMDAQIRRGLETKQRADKISFMDLPGGK
jgi:hypothetical protein